MSHEALLPHSFDVTFLSSTSVYLLMHMSWSAEQDVRSFSLFSQSAQTKHSKDRAEKKNENAFDSDNDNANDTGIDAAEIALVIIFTLIMIIDLESTIFPASPH